ncbi:MAG: hypothetical protein LBR84_05890 [Tannerella sp.]|nr:hypothetical protein [Tannerella sp.]
MGIVVSTASIAQSSQAWPVLKHYDQQHLYRIALPLGGIGTGTVSLGGRGELRDWEIMNVPGKGYGTIQTGNDAPFFAVYIKPAAGNGTTTLLEGPLYDFEYLHAEGRPVNHHGLPRFSHASFDAAYPFGQVNLTDDNLPVKVKIKGFNPLIPGDEENSGLPIAILRYEVTNTGNQPLEVSVCGSIRNFIGRDGSRFHFDWKGDFMPDGARYNRNEYREMNGLKGIYFTSDSVPENDTAYGNMSLVTPAEGAVTYRTSSKSNNWSNSMLNFWDDFSADGLLTERTEPVTESDPMASLAVKKTVAAGTTETFTFYLTWNFPNRKSWSSTVVGNYYSVKYPDSWQAALQIIPQIPEFERQTLLFVNALLESSYPDEIKEAALFNLATLRSQTVFRLPDGHLMGWEGVFDRYGSCMGSCTHVWNYETATAFLFGKLALTMRDVELNYALREDNGLMNFRAALPLSEASKGNSAAADGQMGCIMKAYRDWKMSGDNEFLQKNWGQIKKALSYAWVEKGWDGNQDGVMEGSQHNTMDVNYFGPNPQMQFWYLGALKAAEQMAKAMKDKSFATKCRRLYEQGSRWTDANLFNGDYYEHKITDPQTFEFLDNENNIPDFQLGKGCLVDQLVGQYMAHICGLGYLADKQHVQTTLKSIMKNNFVPDFSRHFNNMRSYVMGDEAGLLMASWPKGRLTTPFPYFAEVMTGFEYCAAVGMIYEGNETDALTVIKAIRARHDGAKRNPFSEPECGHHYARSMASWSAIPALSGFHWSGIDGIMEFTSKPGTYFWSNGYAWGTCKISNSEVDLKVLYGTLKIKKLRLDDGREIKYN